MASTFTTFANLERFESRSIGWDFGANLDTIDQGISVHLLANNSGGDISAFQAVKYMTGTDNSFEAVTISTGRAFGILLETTADGDNGHVLTRGMVENESWSFTKGDVIYLDTSGGFSVRTDLAHVSSSGYELYMQPVGVALSATRVFFNFTPFNPLPYCITASAYHVSAGSVTVKFASITGPGTIYYLQSNSATVDFMFRLPPWFYAMPDMAGIWGFRIRYQCAATGTLDVTNVYDGNNHSGDPGITAGTSTSWTTLDVNWDKFNDVASWGPSAGGHVIVACALATANVDIDPFPQLRFEPKPTLFA